MLTFLVAVSAALLCLIAFQLGGIAARQRATNQWLIAALSPKEYSLLDSLKGEPNPDRSVLDQIIKVAAALSVRADEMDRKLAYFRNYIWEEKDTRYKDNILSPPVSYYWDRAFKSRDDPNDYGLWTRERDLNESLERAVERPNEKKSARTDSTDSKERE